MSLDMPCDFTDVVKSSSVTWKYTSDIDNMKALVKSLVRIGPFIMTYLLLDPAHVW